MGNINFRCKIMVAIDGINTFFYDAVRIRRKDKSVVPYNCITAYDAFKQMLDADWVMFYKNCFILKVYDVHEQRYVYASICS